MFNIFADSHKIISIKIYENIFDIYGVKLDKEKLLWGSICPDILPKYKLVRHYKDESINFIVQEIIKSIFIGRCLEFNKGLDPITIKILSKKIGIISHYLSDYVCLPHANRWTFSDNMIKHIKYESRLNDFATSYDFKKNIINIDDLDIYDVNILSIKGKIIDYIENVIGEYSLKTGYNYDLDFALSLNLKITYFIIDIIEAYSEDVLRRFALNF